MRKSVWTFSFVLFVYIGFAYAQDLQETLVSTYSHYLDAARSGNFDALLAAKSNEVKKEIQQHLKTKKDRGLFLEWEKFQVPDSFFVQHVDSDSSKNEAYLYILSNFSASEKFGREKGRREMQLTFRKEHNEWKLHLSLALADPDKVSHPADLMMDTTQIDEDQEAEIGGRIIKTEYFPAYTVVILRVVDEDIAAFLPSKAELLKENFNFHELDEWNIYVFTGHPHKTDKAKFFATGGHPADK
jgi:hypothetical protein